MFKINIKIKIIHLTKLSETQYLTRNINCEGFTGGLIYFYLNKKCKVSSGSSVRVLIITLDGNHLWKLDMHDKHDRFLYVYVLLHFLQMITET